jgi:hypothetical protein
MFGILFTTILAGCASAKEVAWDPVFSSPACRAKGEARLLDQALGQAGIDRSRFRFDTNDLMESGYYRSGSLKDEFILPWFEWVRSNPAYAGCFEGESAGALDYYLASPHPVAGTIRHAAGFLGSLPDSEPPVDAHLLGDFDQAINSLCVSAGECGEAEGEMPKDLGRALTPIMWALKEGIEARKKMDNEIGARHDSRWWQEYGGNTLLLSNSGEHPDLLNNGDRIYLLGHGARQDLYKAAAKIAFAVENTKWEQFMGRKGIKYDLRTKAGWIRIRDGSNDLYVEDGEDVLFLLDLGGNDDHLDAVAANKSGANPVSVAIDLSGSDKYHYKAYETVYDREGLLPADTDGRSKKSERYGNFSRSNQCRQGAGTNGIAMLFDFGVEDDYFRSLRCSQGYAHLGVGVLFVEGGNDIFLSESASQGSAQFGIGLLIVGGEGNNVFRSFTLSQGFGFVSGAGFLVDKGGDDKYVCDHGDPEQGGIPLYYSAQLFDNGNVSFCQGAGFGFRGDGGDVDYALNSFREFQKSFLSGGIGILRDMCGDDVYEASVFAQGTGYWQGTGILSDGCGSDKYDAYWYVQAGSAHYAVAIFADSGDGGDVFNGTRRAINVALGTGHDYSIGVFINEKGNDIYYIPSLSAGASNCNGIGLFIDNSGNDKYIASSDYGSGMGNVSGECIKTRPSAVNIGIMIDAGGKDEYNYPESSFPIPGDGKTWGHKSNNLESEYGAGIDGEGETGIHAESSR